MGGRSTNKKTHYAVAVGRSPGIYATWAECEQQVTKFPGARFKGFTNQAEAEQFLSQTATRNNYSTHPVMTTANRWGEEKSGGKSSYSGAVDVSTTSSVNQFHGSSKRGREDDVDERPIVAVGSGCGSGSRDEVFRKEVLQYLCCSPSCVGRITVCVDGSCLSNGRGAGQAVGGYGAYYGHPSHPDNISKHLPVDEKQTNNRGEMRAVLAVLQKEVQKYRDQQRKEASIQGNVLLPPYYWKAPAPAHGTSTPPSLRLLHIRCDSMYVLNGVTNWCAKWALNGWKRRVTPAGRGRGGGRQEEGSHYEEVLNKDLWRAIMATIEEHRQCVMDSIMRNVFPLERFMAARHMESTVVRAEGKESRSGEFPTFALEGHVREAQDAARKVADKLIQHGMLGGANNSSPSHIHWEHVRGHAGDEGNEWADRLAVEGAMYSPLQTHKF